MDWETKEILKTAFEIVLCFFIAVVAAGVLLLIFVALIGLVRWVAMSLGLV